MSDLDFNIFKTLTTNKTKAVSFAKDYDSSLFEYEHRDSAKLILDFIKSYRTTPTKRTLIDRYANTPEELNKINSFWQDIENHIYDDRDFEYDVQELKNRCKKNIIKKMHTSLEEKMQEGADPDTIIKNISLDIQKTSILNNGRTHIQKSAGDYIDEFKDRYESRKNSKVESPSIKTGYSMLDTLTGGFAPAELIVIGGETNSGKSMMLNNMGVQMWMQENTIDTSVDDFKRGYNVLYFSLEMPYEDCYDRFLAKVADVPQRSIRDATLTDEEFGRVGKALDFIDKYQKSGNYFNIVDVPRNVTIEEIELRYQDAVLQFRPDIVVVDYMGLMHDPAKAREQDWLKMGSIAASLHEFSRAYDVIMLTAVQLTDIKRGSKNKGDQEDHQKVGVHRIGRSSQIMHHVNIGIQIETRLHENSLPDMRYHIIKNRKGALGQGNLIKNFEAASLYDVPYVKETPSGSNISANVPELIRKIRDVNEG